MCADRLIAQSDKPIGVFDSGLGGLTVMRAISELLPSEDIVYLGDTARVPYGNRSAATVERYALNATSLLVRQEVKAIVVACNTASAFALRKLQEHFSIPIIGVVLPVAQLAAKRTESSQVGVIGTRGTISSRCYEDALNAAGKSVDKTIDVHALACPLFVPLVEEGWLEGQVTEAVIRTYLEPLRATGIDVLILGCTHYPLLRNPISAALDTCMPNFVSLLDSGKATANKLRTCLKKRGLLKVSDEKARYRFLVTDDAQHFVRGATVFFGSYLPEAEHVDIAEDS